MSYTSAQTKKPPNAKGITLTIGIHLLVVAGVIAMPGIELPDKPFKRSYWEEYSSKSA